MNEFKVGDTVQVTGPLMTGSIGTVVWLYEEREQYLVRFTTGGQDYYSAEDLQRFDP